MASQDEIQVALKMAVEAMGNYDGMAHNAPFAAIEEYAKLASIDYITAEREVMSELSEMLKRLQERSGQ